MTSFDRSWTPINVQRRWRTSLRLSQYNTTTDAFDDVYIHCQLNDVQSAAANVVRAIEHWDYVTVCGFLLIPGSGRCGLVTMHACGQAGCSDKRQRSATE